MGELICLLKPYISFSRTVEYIFAQKINWRCVKTEGKATFFERDLYITSAGMTNQNLTANKVKSDSISSQSNSASSSQKLCWNIEYLQVHIFCLWTLCTDLVTKDKMIIITLPIQSSKILLLVYNLLCSFLTS